MKTKLTGIIILFFIIFPAIADDIYRWTDPVTGQPMSAPYLPPYPIKEKRVAGKLPNGNVIQVILDSNSPEIKAIFRRKQEEEADKKRIAEERIAQEKAAAEAKRIAQEKLEAERIAQEKLEAERIAQEKAAAEAKRIAQEKAAAEAKRIAQEKLEAERIAQERKNEAQEILDSKNNAWDYFFAGPFQGTQKISQEDLPDSESSPKKAILSSIGYIWASLFSNPSREETDAKHPAQEARRIEMEKAEAEQKRLAQEKAEDQHKKVKGAGVAKAASESPIQCKLKQKNIECTVVSDNVKITNVILNRGRCDAPEATTQKDIEALNEFRNKFKPEERKAYFLEDGRPNALGLQIMVEKMARSATADQSFLNTEQYLEAYLRVANDPRGKYGFGDTVTIPAQSCNLIEFTIEANGQNWTWSTH